MIGTETSPPDALDRLAAMLRCVGHPLRLRLLRAMQGGAPTVSELQARTGEAQPTVSRHLAVLRARRVVAAHRDGPSVRYRIIDPRVDVILDCIGEIETGAP